MVILTEFTDFGESLLVSPATAAEQEDAAEELSRELGPTVTNDDFVPLRWNASPHVEISATYDDNIFIQPEDEVDDFIFTLAPGVAIGIWDSEKRRTDGFLDRQDAGAAIDKGRGSYFVVDYTAILLGFANTDSQNAFDQDARVDGRLQAGVWSLAGGARYESKSETNTDIGTRVRRRTLSGEIVATYRISDKTSVDAAFSVRQNDPEDFVESTGWKVESTAAYELTPLTRIGIGGAVGGVAVDGGSDDFFQRVVGRAEYAYSEKLSAELSGGVEFRQSDGRAGDRVNPIFAVQVNYQPASGTRLILEASRTVETSEFRPEESYERTRIAGAIRRAVRPGIHLQLDGGFQHSDYTTFDGEGSREDDYFFVKPGVLYHFASWGNAGATYEYRSNDSTRSDSSFNNNQITFFLNLVY